jgi:putative phosphoesterase
MFVGVISDTHGLLRLRAIEALKGCALIVHAGDVGSLDVLDSLRAVAPVHAVRGNVDTGRWALGLPEAAWVHAGEAPLYVLHQIADLDQAVLGGTCAAVIYGHTHKPSVAFTGSVLYLNPGSAGPRRFRLPVTVARLRIRGSSVIGHEIVDVG